MENIIFGTNEYTFIFVNSQINIQENFSNQEIGPLDLIIGLSDLEDWLGSRNSKP